MLWMNNLTTQSCIWGLDTDGTPISYDFYDPGVTGWSASAYHQNADNTGRMLWMNNLTTQCAVWHMDDTGTPVDYKFYDPGVTGWSAVDYCQ